MRVTVINGSPRKGGNTAIMADAFSEGAQEVGHIVRRIDLADQHIAGCLGCQYCRNHPGECAQDDDMKHILEILNQTDILVLATPVYCFDMTGQMKIMLDRTYARGRDGAPIRKAVLLVDSVSENVHRAVTAQFETMLDYFGWGNGGIEIITGMTVWKDGAMRHAEGLKKVRELGSSLSKDMACPF